MSAAGWVGEGVRDCEISWETSWNVEDEDHMNTTPHSNTAVASSTEAATMLPKFIPSGTMGSGFWTYSI